MTDTNSIAYQSKSLPIHDENNSSLILNQSNVPMDVDDNEIKISISSEINGHISLSSSVNENENNNEQNNQYGVFRLG